jgi:hypothetical protein
MKKSKQQDDGLQFIKKAIETNTISRSEVETMANIDYPLFSFRYLCDVSIKDSNDYKFLLDFIFRLKKLSELGWNEIRKSARHSFGMEKMPKSKIRHNDLLPEFVTREVELHVLRAVGDNRVMVGLQEGKIFHIFFVEAKFGDISPH